MRIAVVGIGYVGLVAAGCFAQDGNSVICVDNDKNKIKKLNRGHIPIYEPGLSEIIERNIAVKRLIFTTDLKQAVDSSRIIFLAVGTPSAADGSADISAVLDVAEQIARLMTEYRIIATKSTVPVGTAKKVNELMNQITDVPFDYVSNPEFLKEGSAVEDFTRPDRVIIGTTSSKVQEVMSRLYAPLMRKRSRIIFMDPTSAEMTKYAANVMLASRISFMNELSELCDILGADIAQVRTGIGSDSRIGNSFLFPGIGYGGSCFPKDVKALIHLGEINDCPMKITQAAHNANYTQQDRFAQRILRYFKNYDRGVTLGVWGLAFKARTDDIRESPAIHCIEKLLAAGFKIKAYDPAAMKHTSEYLDAKIETADNSYDVLAGADALVVFTDWQEFRTPNFDMIKSKLQNAVIFDGRNLYDPEHLKKQGFEYYCIGRNNTEAL
jgi:UDPglucose 6-dehydrogenase